MSLRAYYLSPEGILQRDIPESNIVELYRSGKGLLWVDVDEAIERDLQFLEHELKFHHLAVEDCLSTAIHSPKIDSFGDHLFIIVHGINHQVESDVVETAELSIFLGANFVVTSHHVQLYSVSAIRQAVENDGFPMKQGADFLVHSIIDALVDNVMPTIDRMDDLADGIEEEVLRLHAANVLDAILKLKHSAMKVRRIMMPQKDVLNRLSRGEFPQVNQKAQIFFRDVYDHITRIEDLNANTLDRADNALATYLSSVANRQNETMRVLSIVATIFMPLTLLVGIYGMNFQHMPELTWRWGYFVVLGVIAVVILVMVWRFWAAGWIRQSRKMTGWINPFVVEGQKLRGYLSMTSKKKDREEQDLGAGTV